MKKYNRENERMLSRQRQCKSEEEELATYEVEKDDRCRNGCHDEKPGI